MGFAARYIELRDFAAKNAQTVETTVKSLVRLPRARVVQITTTVVMLIVYRALLPSPLRLA